MLCVGGLTVTSSSATDLVLVHLAGVFLVAAFFLVDLAVVFLLLLAVEVLALAVVLLERRGLAAVLVLATVGVPQKRTGKRERIVRHGK